MKWNWPEAYYVASWSYSNRVQCDKVGKMKAIIVRSVTLTLQQVSCFCSCNIEFIHRYHRKQNYLIYK